MHIEQVIFNLGILAGKASRDGRKMDVERYLDAYNVLRGIIDGTFPELWEQEPPFVVADVKKI